MENFNNTSEEKTSKFHGAFDQLRRIDVLWAMTHKDVRSGNYLNWNTCLDRLWMEFIADLEQNSQEEKDFDKINKELLEVYPLVSSLDKNFNKKPEGFDKKVSKQYLLLTKKESFVRRIQNKLGKGTAWRDEYEDDFE